VLSDSLLTRCFEANTVSLVSVYPAVTDNSYYEVTINITFNLHDFKMASGPAFGWWPQADMKQCTVATAAVIRLAVTRSPQVSAHLLACQGKGYYHTNGQTESVI